jgi:predicted unusual protein kinase regulating ubiquinone biosynthesis (AarF/ABC1/UbiB family)
MAGNSKQGGDGITTGRLARSVPVARLAARATGDLVIDALRRGDPTPEVSARRAERYVEVLGHSKGALMKAGQMLSVIPIGTTIPMENRAAFQAAMAHLQADAPPMAPELAAEVIQAELGSPPELLFAEFSPMPIAAASIGQVHRARLHDGREVAVKVQYPGVADAIRSDLRNTELIAVFLQLIRSITFGIFRTNPKEVAAEISERISEEVDYRLEASNQTFFADAFRGHPFIRVPDVIPQLSTGQVLTQEFVDGLCWDDALSARQDLRNDWGDALFRFASRSMLHLNILNSDPNPGNYVFHLDGTVSFLDFGCVKRFSAWRIAQLRKSYQAVMRQDARALREAAVEGGGLDPKKGPTGEEMLEYYDARMELYLGTQPAHQTPEHMAKIMEHEYAMTGASGKVLRGASLPPDLVFFNRVDLGLFGLAAELRCISDVAALLNELYFDAVPSSPRGLADAMFWSAKSVPA